MKKEIVLAQVIGQEKLASDVNRLELLAPAIAAGAQAGQFVTVAVTDQAAPLLRRPFGIAEVNKKAGTITLMYRVLGPATHLLTRLLPKDQVNVMGPLGHGFTIAGKKPLLIGGGMGLAPLNFLADSFAPVPVEVLMGGKTKSELFWQKIFADKTKCLHLTTDDGSLGTKGTVMALLPQLLTGGYDRVYVCGPSPMMRAVVAEVNKTDIPCEISLEKYMGCGLGACLSCSCQGIGKRLKVCTDGPVFASGEVVEW
jgi:dihydroorotate dehydrogenase electron transfer subunit